MDDQYNDLVLDVPPGVDRDLVERVMQETDPDSVVEEYLDEYRRWQAELLLLGCPRHV